MKKKAKAQFTLPHCIISDHCHGLLHVMNFGTSQAVICNNSKAHVLTKMHTTTNRMEMKKVLERGGFISSSGLVNSVMKVTRALGFHGDAKLREALSRNPHFQTVALSDHDEFVIIGSFDYIDNNVPLYDELY